MYDGPPAPWGPYKDYIFQDIIMFLLLLFLTLATAQCQVNDSLNESLTTIPVQVETPIVIELTASPPLSDSPSTLTPTEQVVIDDIPSTPSSKNESLPEVPPPPYTTEPTESPTSERDDYGLYPFPLVPPTETPPTDAPSPQEEKGIIPIPIPIRGQTPTSSASYTSPYLAVLLCLLTQIMSFIT
jgi:hypothetical protein